jgi:hypothetical protein
MDGARSARSDGLVVEWIDSEALVYDTRTEQAHHLNSDAAVLFKAADSDFSRRQVLRKFALAGAAAAATAPLVKTIVAPTPAMAQSTACGAATCTAGQVCCDATTDLCCTTGTCCGFGAGLSFCTAPCDATTCTGGICS